MSTPFFPSLVNLTEPKIHMHLFRWFLLVFVFTYAQFSQADWVNLNGSPQALNIAEIFVLDDHVRVKLEVYVGDLEKFAELVPDDLLRDPGDARPSLEQRMQTFATERLQFITGEGVKLPAKLALVEPRMRVERQSPAAGSINPITRQPVKGAPSDKRVLYAEIIYPFDEKPAQLSIIPLMDAQGIVSAEIGFVAYHRAMPIIDFRYLSRQVKLNLDWEDPWYSKFDNKTLSRHFKYPLSLYLYVEPRQVRLESLIRVSDMASLTGFKVEGSGLSVKDKHLLLRKHIENYYADKDALQIDGVSFKPDSIRVEFLNVTLAGLKLADITTAIAESSLLVGVSQQYPIAGLPQKIDSVWPYFPQQVARIRVVVTDPVGPLTSLIDADDPEFGWQNFLKKYTEPVMRPVEVNTGWSVSIPFVGDTKIVSWMPDDQQASQIISDVFENIRVAFIEKEPGSFTRALGEVISSNQARALHKELAKLFSPTVAGAGGTSSVQAFYDLKINGMRELDNPDGFGATISGFANISAQHWGHTDRRQFQFQLLLDLIEVNQQWRLADLTVVDIKEAR